MPETSKFKKLPKKPNVDEKSADRLLHREDILHHHSGGTFTEKEVNIVLLIILAVIALLFWMPLAEFVH